MADKDEIIEINPYTIKYDTKTERFLKKGVLPKIGWGALTSTAIFAGLAVATVATGGLALGAGAATAAVVTGNIAGTAVAAGTTAQALYSGIMYRSRLSKARFDKLGLEQTIDLIKEMEEDCVIYREKLQELEAVDDKTISVKGVTMNKRQLKNAIKEREDQVHHGLRYLYDVGIKCSKRINYLNSKTVLSEDEISAKNGQQAQLSLIHNCTKEICSHFTEGFNPYKGLIVKTLENGCLLGTDEQNSKIRNLNQHPDSSRAFDLFHEMYEKDALAEREEYEARAEAMKLKPECERLSALVKETVKHKELSEAAKTILNKANDNLKAAIESLHYEEMKWAITKAKEALIAANKEIVSYHQAKGKTLAEVIQGAGDEHKKYGKLMASSTSLGIVGPEKWLETAQQVKDLINKYEEGKDVDIDKLNTLVETLRQQNEEYVQEASTVKLENNIKAAKENAKNVIARFEAASYPNTKRPISAKQAATITNIRELCAKEDISKEELATLKGLTSSLEKVTIQREQFVKEDSAYELGKKSIDGVRAKLDESETLLRATKAELGRTRKRVVETRTENQQIAEQADVLRGENTRLNFDLYQAQMLSEDENKAREHAEGVAYDEFVARTTAEARIGDLETELDESRENSWRNFSGLLAAQAELEEAQRMGAEYAYDAHLAQQRAQTAERNLEQAHTTIDELVDENARANAKAEGISKTLRKVSARQKASNKDNAKLTKKAGKLQGQVNDLEAQVDVSRDIAFDENTARLTAEARVEELEEQVGERGGIIADLIQSNEKLEKLAQGRLGTIRGQQRKLVKNEKEIEIAQTAAYDERKALEEAQRIGADYAYDAYIAQRRAEVAESGLENAKTAAEEQFAENIVANKKIEGINNTVSGLAARVRTQDKDIAQREKQVKQVSADLEIAERKLAAAQRSSVKKNNKIKKLEKEVEARKGELESAKAQLADTEEKFGAVVAEAYDLNAENQNLYSSAVQVDEARNAETTKRQAAEKARSNAEFGKLVESQRREKAEATAKEAQRNAKQAEEDAKYARAERDSAIASRQNTERKVEELTSAVKGMDKQLTAALSSSIKLEEELAYTQRENETLRQDNAVLTDATVEDAYKIDQLIKAIAEQDEALLGKERDAITQLSNRDIAGEQRRLKDSINKIIAHMDYVSSANNPVYDEQIEKTWSELDIVLSQIADERLKYADADDIKQKRMLLEQLYKNNSTSWPKMPKEYETKKTLKKPEDKMGLDF